MFSQALHVWTASSTARLVSTFPCACHYQLNVMEYHCVWMGLMRGIVQVCITLLMTTMLCDGNYDCMDGSDELDCRKSDCYQSLLA